MSNLRKMLRRTRTLGLAFAVAWLAAIGGAQGQGESLHRELERLVERGGVAVGEGQRVIFSFGVGAFVPASIIKLATALAAFHHLGPDYRFKTEFFRDAGGNLIVRGYGDPYLVSEEWELIGGELAARGLLDVPFENLLLDSSAFAADLEVDGAGGSLNPYDARVGALVANFNTVFLEVNSAGTVASAEPQTPLTPFAVELARGLPPGQHRINLSRREGAGLRYTGELVREMLSQAGARFRGGVTSGAVPSGLAPAHVHFSSRPLKEVVRQMMEFSNNFIANQILLAMALERGVVPARLADGIASLEGYLRDELGLERGSFFLVEGSGISPKNRIEVAAMLRIVEAFRPWRELLRPYGTSPRALAKTGTLTGIYSLAGFLPGPKRRAFAIMLNQRRNTRGAVYRRLVAAFGGAAPVAPAPAR